MKEYEKLNAFYLGRVYDRINKVTTKQNVLYESKHLTTHGVCVGMTGSGKTGLCVALLEEACIDNIPSIIIDPKGDITNLLLTFPDLKGESFSPWVNESEAANKNLSLEEYASQQAADWKKGLADWDQDGERIKRLKDSVEFNIYTPGSTAGIPLSILSALEAPSKEILGDKDLLNDKIAITVTSILNLIGINADPIKSKEHILLSTILNNAWRKGESLTLASLIENVQTPQVTKVGVLDLETFYPSKERFELAMNINNLLSSPTFASWLEGEPLEVKNFLYNGTGKPKCSIFYIAHLSETERMFFVSLFLNQVLGWVRSQSGTASLRALLYFDEIFGYLPPVANPPSKKPLLTLLKQARAFGLGIVAATQNPVDLDYKGLANTGTWFIGRLQTEQDRNRLLDGMEGAFKEAGSGFDRKTLDNLVSNLDKRVFLLHSSYLKEPLLFNSRWAMSYLRGPLTREQIKKLKDTSVLGYSTQAETGTKKGASKSASLLPPGISQFFMPYFGKQAAAKGLVYKPYIYGSADVDFVNTAKKIDLKNRYTVAVPVTKEPIAVNWDSALSVELTETELLKKGEENISFDDLPAAAKDASSYKKWKQELEEYLYRNYKTDLYKSPLLNVTSEAGETAVDFKIRLQQLARERKDELIDKLKAKYETKFNSLESKMRTAQERIAREESQSQQQTLQTAISIGSTVLGALFGKKAVSQSTIGRAGTAMRSAGRKMKEVEDVKRAKENLTLLEGQMAELEQKFNDEVAQLSESLDVSLEQFETISIRPKKTDINVRFFSLVWAPYRIMENNNYEKAW